MYKKKMLKLLVLVVLISLIWFFLGNFLLSTVFVILPGTHVPKLTQRNEVVYDVTESTTLRFCSKGRFRLYVDYESLDSKISGSPDCHYEVNYDINHTEEDIIIRKTLNVEEGSARMRFNKGVAYIYLRGYLVYGIDYLISLAMVFSLIVGGIAFRLIQVEDDSKKK